jgi:preprotein translocase subunit SecA
MADRRMAILPRGVELAPGKPYPERIEDAPGWHDRLALALAQVTARPLIRLLRDPAAGLRAIVTAAGRHDATFRAATDGALLAHARGMRARFRRDGFTPEATAECFALVSEAANRTLGMRHFPSQLMAGWALLRGLLVEMETGEGKTFAATLPACAVALAGYPVHIVTVNDYLARRDAETMGPLYRFLGLDAAAVVGGMPREDRVHAYGRPIVYCGNKEVAFDYLRDGVSVSGRGGGARRPIGQDRIGKDRDLVLRGLCFGIVDEADSVFVDEARTPLILSAVSGPTDGRAACEEALEVARTLAEDVDYKLDRTLRHATLEDPGRAAIADRADGRDGVWTSARGREELVAHALSALHLFVRDQHYLVTDGKVQIIDESTGRIMPDRSWERGLHQLIETKEGCPLTEQRETLARVTYQRLFRRYVLLAGMTGTAREVETEVRSVYGLDAVRVPLHRPSLRRYEPPRAYLNRAAKWDAVVEDVRRRAHGEERPVLIGTRSVAASDELSALLTARGIGHELLNARQDAREAEIIAAAGEAGRVTVATNMAGRGTDIKLGPGVAESGGLHVILTEYHESRRIDRQLFGRCARQGDPGTCQAIVALDDELFSTFAPIAAHTAALFARPGGTVPGPVLSLLRWLAQQSAERRAARARLDNLRADQRWDRMLAFTGRGE